MDNKKCSQRTEPHVGVISTEVLNNFITRFNEKFICKKKYSLLAVETNNRVLFQQLNKLKNDMAFSVSIGKFTDDGIAGRVIITEISKLLSRNEVL